MVNELRHKFKVGMSPKSLRLKQIQSNCIHPATRTHLLAQTLPRVTG